MSLLYGILSHSFMNKTLREHRKNPFCTCCGRTNKRKENKSRTKFHNRMEQFLQQHHLSVFGVEKSIQACGLKGRVDCIFKRCDIGGGGNKSILYIVDWKFQNYIPDNLSMTFRLQLNMYKYIMMHMKKFEQFKIEMFVFIFHTNKIELEIFKVDDINQLFIQELIKNNHLF